MLGDSLVRNLFDGLAAHAKLRREKGVSYGTKNKQADATAVADAAGRTLVSLHWAPCAVPAELPPPAGLSPIGAVQWTECQVATAVGLSHPLRPRNLEDLLRGFGVRRPLPAESLPCPEAPARCVVERSTGLAAEEADDSRQCTVGYAAPSGTASPRSEPTAVADLVWSTWSQQCEPPDTVLLNLGLWQTEILNQTLPALESAIEEHLLGIGVERVVLLLPWRVRDVQAASGAAPKPDGGRPFILFADERLLEVGAGMRDVCGRINAKARAEPGEGRKAPRCGVLDPWGPAYGKHLEQRDRKAGQEGREGGWWTDNRHIAPESDLMGAIVELLLAEIAPG